MDRNKHHVSAVIHQFYHFMYAAEVIFHFHQPAENTHTVIDMHHIIAQIEGT